MPYIASMGIYVISKDVMLNLLRDKFPGANDFGSEVIPGATSIGMRVSVIISTSCQIDLDSFPFERVLVFCSNSMSLWNCSAL